MTFIQDHSAFEKAYTQLNEKQKKAVDQLFGPVMTIAGPGTGKTQLLAVRVCNIVANTDYDPHNILCLTFTDAGAKEMRARLLKFMGPEAYHVTIETYHGFCNQVIRENPTKFSAYRELANASDLEMVDIMTELIDSLPLDHPLKRLKGQTYYDLRKIKEVFDTMKQEGWTPAMIETALDEYEQEIKSSEEYIYKISRNGYKKGELKENSIKKELDKYTNGLASSHLIDTYQDLLLKRDRIDYNDSILYVINAFQEDDDLLGYYQERYQFILADEYQDTNGKQNELLFLLASYDDQPNLFVVGDDDQAIYRFQGANMNNIVEFKERFKPLEIVLDKNYRSHQSILDKAMLLIEQNDERLASRFNHLKKELKESRIDRFGYGATPEVVKYDSIQAQDIGVIEQVATLHKTGVPYHEMAIIYKKHREAANLVKYFSYKNIPLNIKKKVNILDQHDIKRLITLLNFILNESRYPGSADAELFELLHYSFFNISANDIAKIAIFCSRKTDEETDNYSYKQVISDLALLEQAGVEQESKLHEVSKVLNGWIKDQYNVTIQVLFEKIMTQSGFLNEVLQSSDKSWRLQVVNSFFNYMKEEAAADPALDIGSFVSRLEKMNEHRIELPIEHVITSGEGINFMTAHGSKGLEFGHVFILNASEEQWMKEKQKGGPQGFKLPPTLTKSSGIENSEDDRRLFYVALTRAQHYAYISYPHTNHNDKTMQPVRFISEMGYDAEVELRIPKRETEEDYISTIVQFSETSAALIDPEFVNDILENLHMSATGVAKYLRCKTAFYFENLLRVPMARTASMGYGNAIHYALEKYIIALEHDIERKLPSLEVLIGLFVKGMDKFKSHFTKEEFEASLFNGKKSLPIYYRDRIMNWVIPRAFKPELKIKTEYNGIPINGVIDRLDIYDQHITVTDYKTGSHKYNKLYPPGKNEKYPYGGDYWIQVMFYKILVDQYRDLTKPMTKATMDFVQPDKSDELKEVTFGKEDFQSDQVGTFIKTAYDGIKSHDFTPGCGEDDCKWCNFVKINMQLQSPLGEGREDIEEL